MQWHRTRAQMERWLEEFELKHVEFMRCIKYFHTFSAIWNSLASNSSMPGMAAFSRRQSSLYWNLHSSAKEWFSKSAEPRFLAITEENLIRTILSFRQQELGWLTKYARLPLDK